MTVFGRGEADERGEGDDPAEDGPGLSDDELTALALAADPDAPLADDAVPMAVHLGRLGTVLPLWYMPPAVARTGHRWRVPIVTAIVGAFLLIEALGLCNTYGVLSFA